MRDIHPRSPVASLRRDYRESDLALSFDIDLVAPLVGMSESFVRQVIPKWAGGRVTLEQVLLLLDQDAFAETFVPRSQIPPYLIAQATTKPKPNRSGQCSTVGDHELIQGNAADLIPTFPDASVQCIVTSTPYWGTRLYEEHFAHTWADGEECPLGHEQTPEGFIRHTVEILYLLKRVLRNQGSIFWNLMDVFNTRTQIRSNASETLNAMRGNETRGWGDYACRRYSAGHAYLKDGEQCGIPGRVATRLSRIGYYVKSVISWKKNGSLPETVETRATREVEYVIHVSKQRSPTFNKKAFLDLPESLGGRNPRYEAEKLTDVWHFSTATGMDGHGAQFPTMLPARCIALSTVEGDRVLDPFVGSGTTLVAAQLLGRRSVGVDVSNFYLAVAKRRLLSAASGPTPAPLRSTRARRTS
ncbi:MAG TPA: site-specific DNA-methyltransferase [Vicinamibacterales bacterium]|jgi:DNA modification methylase|nr:site-specific DNA-methyltransferase [Vicinamibacterales bacterium]